MNTSICRVSRNWAFGSLLLTIALLAGNNASAQERTLPKLVSVGPMRLMATRQGLRFRPQLAIADRLVVQVDRRGQQPNWAALRTADGPVVVHRDLGRGSYIVSLPPNSDLLTAARQLRTQPGVRLVEPDCLIYPSLIPNDPKYADQYHLPLIAAPAAWDISTGATSVTIAIIDSGVWTSHPDLKTKIVSGGYDFYNGTNDPNPKPTGKDVDGDGLPDGEVGHGTLVAGLAAAVTNDNYGTAGVSWGAKILPLKVFPADGGTEVSTVISAINYAITKHVDIINLSMGGGYSPAFTQPLADAYAAGIVVVAAGGNEALEFTDSQSTWESPVCNDGDGVGDNHVIGVGATDRYDRKTSYSNFDSATAHRFIDIMAPGDALCGPAPYFPAFPAFTSYFQTNSGTSFAAPLISGLCALLKTINPSATPAWIISQVRASGDNIDTLNPGYTGKLGGGRINLARALGVTLPPAAVLDLAAVDTPNDEGGSITLTWRKSPDDGAGSNKVTQYIIFRREGTGSWVQRATRPAGTESYIDSTTGDGTKYYYKVCTSDGSLATDSAVVGPVESRNDSPPAAVTGLTAADRPGDSGGAIVLHWDAYSAPADFKAFNIYRAAKSFTSTLGMTALVQLTDKTCVQYIDTTTSDGVDYYYAVGVVDTFGNEIRAVRAVGPVQSFSNGAVTLAAGLHFMGTPVVPVDGDPATFFGMPAGSFLYARWAPQAARYVNDTGARPLQENLVMGIGRGFWVNLISPVTVLPEGQSAPAGDFSVSLTPGWHQLANPYFASLDFSQSTVTYQGTVYDLDGANQAGILAAFAWTYDTVSKQYSLAYPPLPQAHPIESWQGFWVLAQKNCTLALPRPLAPRQAASTITSQAVVHGKSLALKPGWLLPLQVSSSVGSDANCVIGTASSQFVVPKPPAANSAPKLAAAAPGAQGTGRYAVSLAQTASTGLTWNLQVEGLQAGQPVKLTSPDLSALPSDAVAVLQDLATGQSVYLRTTREYSFTPRSDEIARSFQLTISTRAAATLAVQGLVTQEVHGGGAQIMFNLSNAASCTVSVMNISGRTVRIIEEGRLRTAGNNVLLWDGCSQLGTRAPAGQYLLQVSAQTPSGQSVRAISPLRIGQ